MPPERQEKGEKNLVARKGLASRVSDLIAQEKTRLRRGEPAQSLQRSRSAPLLKKAILQLRIGIDSKAYGDQKHR